MHTPGFPVVRPRRLRANPLVRDMVRETTLDVGDFILPMFVRPGSGVRQEISSMPGFAAWPCNSADDMPPPLLCL